MYKISVVIPVFNVEAYLKRCIESLLAQTLDGILFIFIDDCSTDNSLAVLNCHKNRFKHCKVFHLEENRGAAYARNVGLRFADSEYIGFVDPDDCVEPNFFEALYKAASKNAADIAKATVKTVEPDGTVLQDWSNTRIREDKFFFYKEWWTAIYSAKLIKGNNITFKDELIKAQDTLFQVQCVCRANTIVLIDDVAYIYNKRLNSLNSKILNIDKFWSGLHVSLSVLQEFNRIYSSMGDALYIKWFDYFYNNNLFGHVLRDFSSEGMNVLSKCLIKGYQMCLKKDLLEKKMKYKKVIIHIKNSDIDNLAKILDTVMCKKDLEKLL